MARLEIKNLNYYYPESALPALKNINLTVPAGEFILLTGASGSGKSTLLKAITGIVPDFQSGRMEGNIYLDGKTIKNWTHRGRASKIGMLMQNPESQMLMTSVAREIIFGMENLGLDNRLMRRRLAEIAAFMDLNALLGSSIPHLSGGTKQKVALAALLAMQPEILLLDEPTSQLDPVAAEELLSILQRINEENAITIIMAEQRLERCYHRVDRDLVMKNGQITGRFDSPAAAGYAEYIPTVPRLFIENACGEIPLTVKEGRRVLSRLPEQAGDSGTGPAESKPFLRPLQKELLVDVQKLWFSYPNGQEVLKDINLQVKQGDFIVFMGDNGAGKSTLLKTINGLLKPCRGKVIIKGRDTRRTAVEKLAGDIGYLSQNPADYLFLPTVREEIMFSLRNLGIPAGKCVDEIIDTFKLGKYADHNPRDLSFGEMQRVALAAVMGSNPQILLLDEPTRGLDMAAKKELGSLLTKMQAEGTAVIMVSHDVEFAAEYAADVYLLAQGEIAARGSKYEIMSQSNFYSPQVNRLFRGYIDGIVTYEEGSQALRRILLKSGKQQELG